MAGQTKPTALQVTKGGDTVDNITPRTLLSEGSFKLAVDAGGRVLLLGNISQVTEQQPPAGTSVELHGTVTNATHYFTYVPQGNFVSIRGGRYINTNQVTPQSIVRTVNNSGLERLDISDMDITGDVQEDGTPSYAIDLRGVTAATIRDVTARKYTGAVSLAGCRDVLISNVRAQNMVFIPAENAGGYGALLSACRNVLIDGLHFRAVADEGAKGRHAFYVSMDGTGIPNNGIIIKNVFAVYSNLQHKFMYTGVLRACNDVTIENIHTVGGNAGLGLNPENGTLSNVKILNNYIQVIQIDDNTPAYGMATSDFGASPINSYVNFFVSNVIFDMVLPAGITRKMTCAIRFNGRDSHFQSIQILESSNPATAGISPIVLGNSFNLLFDGIMFRNRSSNPAFLFEANVEQLKIRNLSNAGVVFDVPNLIQYGRDVSVDWSRKSQVSVSSGAITLADPDGLFSSVTVNTINCVIRFNNHVTWDAIDSCTLNVITGTGAQIIGRNQANREITVRVFSGATAINFASSAAGFHVTLNK